jgi:hypothetical protein
VPSWKLHRRWAERYGIPEHIASSVDKLIDGGAVHDLGEVKKPRIRSPTGMEIPLRPVHTSFGLVYALKVLFGGGSDYVYAVRAALLHHFLDKVERVLRECGASICGARPDAVVDAAYAKMLQHGLDMLSRDELEKIYMFLKVNASDVVKDIVADRGLSPIGPSTLAMLLRGYIEGHGYDTLVWIPSHEPRRPLPLTAAARKILSALNRGEEVSIQFSRRTDHYPATHPYRFRNLEDLVEFLESG